jgi:hypothetical protein
MAEAISVPPDDYFLSPEDKALFARPDAAPYNVWVDCDLLPVGRMFGMDGQIVFNPLHAFACVAFKDRQWQMVPCRPGDVTPRLKDRPWLR